MVSFFLLYTSCFSLWRSSITYLYLSNPNYRKNYQKASQDNFVLNLQERSDAHEQIDASGLFQTKLFLAHSLFSHSVLSDSLQPHGLLHQAFLSFTIFQSFLRLMCIKLVIPSSHLFLCGPLNSYFLSFLASGSFPKSQLFASGGLNIGASASASWSIKPGY